jgi:hypothetical protein
LQVFFVSSAIPSAGRAGASDGHLTGLTTAIRIAPIFGFSADPVSGVVAAIVKRASTATNLGKPDEITSRKSPSVYLSGA